MLGFNSRIPGIGGALSEKAELFFYNVANVTTAELWQSVGEELQRARLRRKWKPLDVERADGPSYKTVQAIEAGDVGTVESLDKYARALHLSIVDVLYSVLASRETPLSPEASQIVRRFSETTIAGRAALLQVANALPSSIVVTGTAPIPDAAPTPRAPRRSRTGPRVKARRTAE